ncbi:transmembrane protein [Dunaliella salina]|uniref:Transmembrane protein 231 n=2 Tax=Dunaliella salina TaxID=3046 RepID=A0ABQ7H897_DUNSA|nr:transmembrane protein [Dunaliella salina]|eukprot:KAF5843079.1 transmembrane protein [Dunaliella salina]
MVQVYTEHLCRRHYSPFISDAVLFRIFLLFTNIALSLILPVATGAFWKRVKFVHEQPLVRYTEDALLLFEGAMPGQERIWSSSQAVNEQFSDFFIPASIQAYEEDVNFDGKPDAIRFNAKVQGTSPVFGVKALLQFHYEISDDVILKFFGLAYAAHTSALPGGELYLDGELELRQLTPITDKKFNGEFDTPILDSSQSEVAEAVRGSEVLQFESIVKSYLSRNYSTTFIDRYPVWKPGAGNSFMLDWNLRIPTHQMITVRPQVIEMLKFAWIQFLATFIAIWFFFHWLQIFVFRYRIFDTRAVSDVQPKTQRF